jgi:hypothetical protein
MLRYSVNRINSTINGSRINDTLLKQLLIHQLQFDKLEQILIFLVHLHFLAGHAILPDIPGVCNSSTA